MLFSGQLDLYWAYEGIWDDWQQFCFPWAVEKYLRYSHEPPRYVSSDEDSITDITIVKNNKIISFLILLLNFLQILSNFIIYSRVVN
jgi:hypothetical protein